MRKIICLVWALAFLLFFESCSKEKVQPATNTKSNASQQPANAQSQPENPPSSQPPSCPHASGNPTNAG
jgi:hypothetical protein